MRESFGGAFIIKLILVFIIIYVSFMAVAINYAKAFRVKNNVINIIEQNLFTGSNDTLTITKIDDYLSGVPYLYNEAYYPQLKNKCSQFAGSNNFVYTTNGACIITKDSATNSRYYQVVTFISIDFPFFQLHMIIPVTGETKVIKI